MPIPTDKPLTPKQIRIWWELIGASSFLNDSEKRRLLEHLLGMSLDELTKQAATGAPAH